jgi:hypothetical protein
MIRNISRIFSLAVTFTALVLPIGTASAQSVVTGTNPDPQVVTGTNPDPQVVTGTNPDPQVIVTILLNILALA